MNVFRSSIVPQLSGFEGYIAEIGNRFCPFLEPSAMRDLTLYSTYELGSGSVEQIQALMFCIGLLHTEILRRARVEVPLQQRPLVCENILFRFASEDCVDGVELFGWPHWLLKVRYTQVGVLFGKFWKGEEAVSRKSVPIPPPPYHMLSIRGAVKPRDSEKISFVLMILHLFFSPLRGKGVGTNQTTPVFGDKSQVTLQPFHKETRSNSSTHHQSPCR